VTAKTYSLEVNHNKSYLEGRRHKEKKWQEGKNEKDKRASARI
jgi:hypothetical protein